MALIGERQKAAREGRTQAERDNAQAFLERHGFAVELDHPEATKERDR